MNNFKTALYYSLKPKILDRGFLIFAVGILSVFILISTFGSLYYVNEKDKPLEEIGIISTSEIVDSNVDGFNVLSGYDVKLVDSTETSDDMPYVIDMNDYTVYSNEDMSLTMNVQIGGLISSLKLYSNNYTQEQINDITSLSEFNYVYQGDKNELASSEIFQLINVIFSVLGYMLIIFAIQFLGQEILDEKSSRAMEIIITNINPKVHMFAKIISTTIFILLSALVFIISAIIGVMITLFITKIDLSIIIDLIKTQFELANNNEIIIFTILSIALLLMALVSILLVMAIFSSIAANQEDYQKITLPVTLFVIIPYILSLMEVPTALTKVLGLFPVYNMFFIPGFYITRELTLIYFVLVLLINFIFISIVIKYGSLVYKEGVLNYSSTTFRQIFKNAISNYKYEKQLTKRDN